MDENSMNEIEQLTQERPELAALARESLDAIEAAGTPAELEETRVRLLGKKGSIAAVFKGLGSLPPEEKRTLGQIGNALRTLAESELTARAARLKDAETKERLLREATDVTLPGRRLPQGHDHLLARVIDDVTDIFVSLGYKVVAGPEVELDFYNFEALNTPPHHPARSLQDTLYVRRSDPVSDDPKDILLRTHTSPVQVRVMESERPPLYVISPGKAYRKDEIDATHSPVFHQVEGFAVSEDITMGDLKGTLEVFARKLFGEERAVRFRPHFFPFTEPSAEVDVSCFVCAGGGCSLCKGVGWLEIMGCGMIDPAVFSHVGYDPEKYTGFAFGGGVERIAMLKYGVDDMRVFFENDMRFLRQF
jgi:phenylalanyl-tRNA synthetase alpha chain